MRVNTFLGQHTAKVNVTSILRKLRVICMSLQRLLLTGTSIAIIALAGMGLATAQSSSPFASKKRAQAWEQTPAAPQAAPAYTAPIQQSSAPQAQTYQAPAYQTPTYRAPSVPTTSMPSSPDAPIATRPRRSTALPSYSASTPPKTFAGRAPTPRPAQSQAQPQYNDQMLAGSPTPPQGYVPSRPPTRAVAQAPEFGSPVPPQNASALSAPVTSGSPYAPRTAQRRQGWDSQPSPTPPPPAYQSPSYQAPSYQGRGRAQAPQTQGYQPKAAQPPTYAQNGYTPQGYVPQGYTPSYQSSTPPTGLPPTGAPYPGGPYTPPPQQPRSWMERLGLNNLATAIKGKLNLGGAGTYREQPPNQVGPQDGWSEDFIADAEIEGEVSAITDNGLEYGVVLGVRAQYDPFRRGFGGRLPDCPPTALGCSGQAGGLTTGLRGHTSGFYSVGEDISEDAQVAVESAHLFLRSAYGDVTIGRDDGAAYLFSLGAPTLLAVGASNSPVDYTGYDSVRTVNDASGFAEKITYTSPRLLGDQIGVGVQLGVSYLESFGAGLEFEYGDWTLGGSLLQSNNGLLDGDYTAYDAGLTWKPSALGFTLGYGYAKDDNVGLTANQGTFGASCPSFSGI